MRKIIKRYNWLVTGGAGFIGSNLISHLIKNNQNVICIDNLSNGNIDNLKYFIKLKNFKFIKKDIREINGLSGLKKIDFVIHLAALGSVERSIKNPLETLSVNLNGSLNILNLTKKYKIKKFIFASSSSVYGNSKKNIKKEDDETNPISPYGYSKLFFEMLSKNLSNNIDSKIIGLRFFNVFGPNQKVDGPYAAVIPLWCNNILNNKSIIINGSNKITRDFTYVDNVVSGIFKCCFYKQKNTFQVFNLACGNEISLKKLLNSILSHLKFNSKNIKITTKSFRKGDIKRSKASITKAKKVLKYRVEISFKEGIKKYLNFINKN